MSWTSKSSGERYFDPPPPTADDLANERVIRHGALALFHTILAHSPQNSDQSAAVRQLREATASAVAAIRCRVREPEPEPGPNTYLGPQPL
jgi:hypothetical protein